MLLRRGGGGRPLLLLAPGGIGRPDRRVAERGGDGMIPVLGMAEPEAARRGGLVGAGVSGGGWALHSLRTGFDVDVYDPAAQARTDLLRMVEASWPLLDRMGLRE